MESMEGSFMDGGSANLSLKSRSGSKSQWSSSPEFWTGKPENRKSFGSSWKSKNQQKSLNVEVGTTRSFLPVQNYDIHGHNNGGFEGIALSFALLDFPIKRTR